MFTLTFETQLELDLDVCLHESKNEINACVRAQIYQYVLTEEYPKQLKPPWEYLSLTEGEMLVHRGAPSRSQYFVDLL